MSDPEEITIEIPDFARMTDEEVAAHPLSRLVDGRWSPLTRMLMEAWGTDKLDLNDAWASTWQRWECPACGRRKQEIARASEGGVLLCKLTYHHDHLHEVAKSMFRATDPLPNERHARAGRVRARVAAYAMVERFAETLVCEDCNNADAEMKAALGAAVDPFFSFSPREIRQFVQPEPYRSHTIDIEAGKRVFAVAGPAFEERVAFARMLVDRVGRGMNDIEVAGTLGEVRSSNERMAYRLAYDRAGPRSRLGRLYEALSDRSRSSDGNQSNRRKRTGRQVAAPSAEEFAAICARNAESRPWAAAGEDWCCPICSRTKFEICRKSNRGGWTASIHHLEDYAVEEDGENILWRSRRHCGPIPLGDRSSYALCQDCRHIVTEAVKLSPGADIYCLRPDDVRGLIGEAEPHRMHAVTPEAIQAAVRDNADWIEAVEDFLAHRREATGLVVDVKMLMGEGYERKDAKQQVYDSWLGRQPLPGSDTARFNWLLREGVRLRD